MDNSYDNALAKTINGRYEDEVIHRRGRWERFDAVQFATLEWVDWLNYRRLLEPIGNIPPPALSAKFKPNSLGQTRSCSSVTSCAFILPLIDQPTTRWENRSITAAT